MANKRMKLSDYGIHRLKPPAAGRLEVADLICPGLVLRITPRDVRSWSVVFKVRGEGGYSPTGRPLVGVQHRITLGQYPQVGLAKAREKARALMEIVSEGRDPRPERHEKHREHRSNTVRAVAERFIELDAKPTVETWQRIERTLALHVLPVLGDRPIKDIGKGDLHDLLDGIVENVGRGAAKGALQHMHRLFEFALDRELVTRNPAHKLKRADLKANGDAGRALDDDEVKAIWKACGEIAYPFGPYVKMLILTGQRRNDWANAQHREIDVGERTLTIDKARYKGRREHIVPLAGEAWEIVARLPRWASGDYLFSNREGRVAINSFGRGKARLDKIAGPMAAYTFHDFRRTVETRMAALAIPQEVRDAVIGHMRSGLQKTYNKFDYGQEKRAALAAYAAHLMDIVK